MSRTWYDGKSAKDVLEKRFQWIRIAKEEKSENIFVWIAKNKTAKYKIVKSSI